MQPGQSAEQFIFSECSRLNGVPQNICLPGLSELFRMWNDSSRCETRVFAGVINLRISRKHCLGLGWTLSPMTSALTTEKGKERKLMCRQRQRRG